MSDYGQQFTMKFNHDLHSDASFYERMKKVQHIIAATDPNVDMSPKIFRLLKSKNAPELVKLLNVCRHRFSSKQLFETLLLFINEDLVEETKLILTHTLLSENQLNIACRQAIIQSNADIITLFVRHSGSLLSEKTRKKILQELICQKNDLLVLMCIKRFANLQFETVKSLMLIAIQMNNLQAVKILYATNHESVLKLFFEEFIYKAAQYNHDKVLAFLVTKSSKKIVEKPYYFQDLMLIASQNELTETVIALNATYTEHMNFNKQHISNMAIRHKNPTHFIQSFQDINMLIENQLGGVLKDKLQNYQNIYALTPNEKSIFSNKAGIETVNEYYQSGKSESSEITYMFQYLTLRHVEPTARNSEVKEHNQNRNQFKPW